MTSKARRRLLSMITVLTAGTACTARFISAQTLQEHSAEARFQSSDLHVPDAALAALLPTGWTPNVAAQGPAKGCESARDLHRPDDDQRPGR